MARVICCNKCGKRINKDDIQQKFSYACLIGYGSKYDGCDFEIDLCCSCMDEQIEKLINECAVSPIIKSD